MRTSIAGVAGVAGDPLHHYVTTDVSRAFASGSVNYHMCEMRQLPSLALPVSPKVFRITGTNSHCMVTRNTAMSAASTTAQIV